MDADEYLALYARLDVGRPQIVEVLEHLHPHRPPDDEQWPAPRLLLPRLTSRRPKFALMLARQPTLLLLRRLGSVQALTCALTAAEMVLEYWYGFAERRRLKASHRLAPNVALRNARRFLAGAYRLTDLLDCAEAIGHAVDATSRNVNDSISELAEESLIDERAPRAGVQAARAAMSAVAAVTHLRHMRPGPEPQRDTKTRHWVRNSHDSHESLARLCAKAVLYAALVTPLDRNIPEDLRGHFVHTRRGRYIEDDAQEEWSAYLQKERLREFPGLSAANAFLMTWWGRCRCRLAFVDAAEGEIEQVR